MKNITITQEEYDNLKRAKELLFEATQNLGHPAYGQSSSCTIAIDELREKCFDFLGVPK